MSAKPRTATLETEVPAHLLGQMKSLVESGWFRDLDEIVVHALRRFLDSHRSDLMEELIREDVEWGLHGAD